jgi:hypothetical protein
MTNNIDVKILQETVKKDLPGWRISEASLEQLGFKRTDAIEELKSAVKRDLIGWHLSPNFIEDNEDLTIIPNKFSFIVRMNNSSIEKVAEYNNKKVYLIQG